MSWKTHIIGVALIKCYKWISWHFLPSLSTSPNQSLPVSRHENSLGYSQLVTVEFNFCAVEANVYASKTTRTLQSVHGC